MSQLEPSELTEIFLESKIPTESSILSETGSSVTLERRIQIKNEYEIACNVASKKVPNSKSR